jgi:hypothetical protein
MSMGVVKPYVGVEKRRGGAQDDKGEAAVIPHGGVAKRRGGAQNDIGVAASVIVPEAAATKQAYPQTPEAPC